MSSSEIVDNGNSAYDVGTVSLKAPAADGTSSEVKGQYIVIWTKDAEGNWRLRRDIWNTGPTGN